MSINVIDTEWGHIVELERDKRRSLALVAIDPGRSKAAEVHHLMTETFFPVAGDGWVRRGDEVRKLVPGGDSVRIDPSVDYEIMNFGTVALLFYALVRPPFDPTDVHEV